MKINEYLKKYYLEIIVLIIGLTLGSFLMFSSFSSENNSLQVSTKAWSDFASHIPLIRSFSLGSNLPPEYPLFPGTIIKYHFIFYFVVGMLEKIGFSIGYALNIPSIIGFTFLIFLIYLFAKLVFKSKTVGLLSVIFFIFNSSLSFIYYFQKNPFSINSIKNIPLIENFQSFAPYGDGLVSAFLNLNIYTNQRHLAFAFGVSLAILYLLIRPIFEKEKKQNIALSIVLGIFLGLSFFFHIAVFMMTGIAILFIAILFSKIRKSSFILLVIAGLIALPQYLYLTSSPGFKMIFNPGYLVADKLTLYNLSEFWIYNLGISLILIILGFIFSNRSQKKILLSFIPIFIIGNLIQFSPEIAANHKFFNYFSIITNMFCAFALFILWKKNIFLKFVVIILFFFMIFGGIIDFFPLANDKKILISDYKSNLNANWIVKNTPPDSVFLNTTFIYDSASLAGRKIFLGWPYFAWSQGYDTDGRNIIYKSILEAKDKSQACKLLKENNIDYVEIKIQNPLDPNLPIISNVYLKDFSPSYRNLNEDYSIYEVKKNCP